MHAFRPLAQVRRFQTAAESRQYPTFDLTGEQAQIEALCTALNHLQKLISATLTQEYRNLLNHSSLQVGIDTWQYRPAPTANHWIAAFDADNPGQSAYFGFNSEDLFAVSEVFFGGDPSHLKESAPERTLSETDQRLALRLFNALLKIACPALDLDLERWQCRWLQLPPDLQGLWTELTVGTADWKLRFFCGWPPALSGGQPEPVVIDEARLEQFRQHLHAVKVRLRVQLAQLDLSLGELLQLRKDDILRLDLQETVVAKAGDVACIKGQVCEQGDRLALRVVNGVGDLL